MSDNSIGEKLKVTVFGQSHAPGIGAVIEGYPSGRQIDWDQVSAFMAGAPRDKMPGPPPARRRTPPRFFPV